MITEGLDIVKVFKENTKVQSEISNRRKSKSICKSFVDLKKEELQLKNGNCTSQLEVHLEQGVNTMTITNIQDNNKPMSPMPS